MQLVILLLFLTTISQGFIYTVACQGFTPAANKQSDDGQQFDIASPSAKHLLLTTCTSTLNPKTLGKIEGCFVKAWTSTEMQIIWYINLLKAGSIQVSVGLANDNWNSGSTIVVSIGAASATRLTPFSGGWDKIVGIDFGTFGISQPGKYTVSVQAKSIRGTWTGDLSYVLLSGSALEGANVIKP